MTELNKIGEELLEAAKKYGLMIAICAIIFYSIKKLWFWLVMPLLFLLGFSSFLPCKLEIFQVICMWIFSFSMLQGIGRLLFVANHDKV
jgi:hypothetical protein